MEYRAIVKRNPNSELQHWKYIKRIKGKDGKYRYIYNSTQLRKHQAGVQEHYQRFHDKGVSVANVKYVQGDHFFDKIAYRVTEADLALMESGKKYTMDVMYSQGKLSRGIAKGEKWIYDNLISDKKKQNQSINIQNNYKDKDPKFLVGTAKPKPTQTKPANTTSSRPSTGRKKKVTGIGKKIKRRGQALGGGPHG